MDLLLLVVEGSHVTFMWSDSLLTMVLEVSLTHNGPTIIGCRRFSCHIHVIRQLVDHGLEKAHSQWTYYYRSCRRYYPSYIHLAQRLAGRVTSENSKSWSIYQFQRPGVHIGSLCGFILLHIDTRSKEDVFYLCWHQIK